jgi:hypothetical protein
MKAFLIPEFKKGYDDGGCCNCGTNKPSDHICMQFMHFHFNGGDLLFKLAFCLQEVVSSSISRKIHTFSLPGRAIKGLLYSINKKLKLLFRKAKRFLVFNTLATACSFMRRCHQLFLLSSIKNIAYLQAIVKYCRPVPAYEIQVKKLYKYSTLQPYYRKRYYTQGKYSGGVEYTTQTLENYLNYVLLGLERIYLITKRAMQFVYFVPKSAHGLYHTFKSSILKSISLCSCLSSSQISALLEYYLVNKCQLFFSKTKAISYFTSDLRRVFVNFCHVFPGKFNISLNNVRTDLYDKLINCVSSLSLPPFKVKICLLLILLASEAQAKCTGRFVNPISDICWECLFPISIGGAEIAQGIAPDAGNPSSPICACGLPVPRVGISAGFWEPVRLVDVTREHGGYADEYGHGSGQGGFSW